jgi:CRISPR-associated endonuclease/helicase Cas3
LTSTPATEHAWLRAALGLDATATPFPWQVALLGRFRRGDLPRALDLPTGLGKTAVMSIWLVARAVGAPVPRRLVYVVDRRAVVDQATTVAEGLRDLVDETPELRAALGLGARSLPISTLRGAHVDNRAWLEDPAAPAIVVGTVDMIGSRLLFAGYGVSWKMRPYHAGFLGADTLFVLDEAHLVPPFERLIESVAQALERGLGPAAEVAPLVPRLRLLSLSATGRQTTDSFVLTPADHEDPVVVARISAGKHIRIRNAEEKADLATRLAEEAHGLAARAIGSARIVVFCDTRDDAGKVAEMLRKLLARDQALRDADLELFVGGRRVHERNALAAWLRGHGFIAGGAAATSTSFLIATSAAEVGVDLDADAAVADVVAWERMVQRLGRVNRRGRVTASIILIPLAGDERSPDQREACLALLRELPEVSHGAGALDGSPAALGALRRRAETEPDIARLIGQATTPAPLHPPLDRPLVDAWAMTSLEVHTGRPEVGPWLRGWVEDDEPQVTLTFRAHLPLDANGTPLDKKELESFLDTAGPHVAEELETETWKALDWLETRIDVLSTALAKAGQPLGRLTPVALALDRQRTPRVVTAALLGDKRERERLLRALTGGRILVDARVGGLEHGLLSPKADVPNESSPSLDLTQVDSEVPFRIRRVGSLDDSAATALPVDNAFVIGRDAEGEPADWLLVERRTEAPLSESGRSISRRAQGLAEHQSWAEQEAAAISDRLRLDDGLAQALRLAARLHDEGKQAARWQRAFHVPPGRRPLAKSTRAPNVAALGGYRHELGSLPRIEGNREFLTLDAELRDLVLHLVAAHHGRARPVLPTDGAEEPPTKLRDRAREVALRYERLSRRFGPWGLAWLESLLRAADVRASRRNDEADHG